MSIDHKALRIGNWIHCKGSSHYGIVTGEILAKMERDEKFREKFEYIEITPQLIQAAGFEKNNALLLNKDWILGWDDVKKCLYIQVELDERDGFNIVVDRMDLIHIKHLHRLQQFFEMITGSELPLPESAKIINQAVEK